MATTTTFDSPTALGAKIIPITHTVTNTSGAYSSTIQDVRITPAMQAIKLDIDDPSVFRDKINVACNNGSVTISCNDVVGSTSVKISVIKVDEDPTAVTSIEFDVLNNKITKLSGELAVVIDGNKTAIGAAEGDYVLLKNSTISGKDDGAYTATKAIPANTVIDATYLSSIIDKGIANALNSKIYTTTITVSIPANIQAESSDVTVDVDATKYNWVGTMSGNPSGIHCAYVYVKDSSTLNVMADAWVRRAHIGVQTAIDVNIAIIGVLK